jgi:hypothetical protein
MQVIRYESIKIGKQIDFQCYFSIIRKCSHNAALLSFLLTLVSLSALSQVRYPIIDTSLTWYHHREECVDPYAGTFNRYNYTFYFKGQDTVINGRTYNKTNRDIMVRMDTFNRYYLTCYTCDSESLLYDFNARVGDTIYTNPSDSSKYYAILSFDTNTIINGSNRRHYNVFCHDNSLLGNGMPNDWIEGIGGTWKAMGNYNCPNQGQGCSDDFCGVSLQNTFIYGSACSAASVSSVPSSAPFITLLHTKDELVIHTDINIVSYRLINSIGQEVDAYLLNNLKISMRGIASGLYILELKDSSGLLYEKKIINNQ